MKPGDLIIVNAPKGWRENSLTAQCHGKMGIIVKELSDGWCSLLIDGRLITLHYFALKPINETR